MNEKSTKRREWVKTAAIVFLSVMLVLTFFSQTIMNYSLPVVAAQYVTSGSITAKVRGTGVVEAGDPYQVELTETRKIASVAVKKGDAVEKDQVLFYLEDAESAELEEAQKTLDAMLLEFKTALLTGDISDTAIDHAQSGVEASTDTYQARISAAQKAVDTYKAQTAELEKQKALLTINGTVDTTAEDAAVAAAQTKLDTAQANLASAKAALDGIVLDFASKADAQANMDGLKTVADAYLLPMQQAETDMNKAAAAKDNYVKIRAARAAYDTVKDNSSSTEEEKKNAEAIWTAAVEASGIDGYTKDTLLTTIDTDLAKAQDNFGKSAEAYSKAKESYDTAYAAYQKAKEQYDKFDQKANAQTAVNNAQNAVNSAQKEYDSAIKVKNDKIKNGDTSGASADIEKKLLDANAALKQAEEAMTQLLTDISAEVTIGAKNSAIQEQREKVEKLQEKAVGAEVKAPVAGTITDISCIAGEEIKPGNPLAVIQPDGKGFSLSFSVTADQAKKLTPGDPADVQNGWYYSDITATLAQVKNDPENPGKNKILVFDIAGDVTGGQSLSLSVGQKSSNYDMIVPNSAIREDNNGKFILIVESKSSPLGNRYIASRVDVEVLASDDIQSAISGALYGYEFVITTSNKPVEAGKQVRLSDN